MKTLYLFMAMVLAAAAASGQEPLGLDSCRNLALQNQSALRVASIKVEQAEQTRMEALTKYFPQLSGTAAWFHSKDYMINVSNDGLEGSGAQLDVNGTIRGVGVTSGNRLLDQVVDYLDVDLDASLKMLDHGAMANLLLVQPVFAGGRISSGNKLARLGVTAAQLQQELAEDEVMMRVEECYWMLSTLYAKEEALGQALMMLDTLRRDAEAGTMAGVIGRNDLLKVKLKQNELHAAQTQLANGIRLATMALQQYVGLPMNPDIRYRLDEPRIGMVPSLEYVAYADTTIRRKEAELLDMNLKAKRLEHRMTIGEALPQVVVGATYGMNNILNNTFNANGLVFASAQIPLSGWWETAHKGRKQALEAQMAEVQREDLLQQLRLQNQQIYNEMMESIELVATRLQAVEDATSNLDEVRNYYEAGMSSMSDYLEAQTMLQQTRTDLADQLMTARMKMLRWQQVQPARQ